MLKYSCKYVSFTKVGNAEFENEDSISVPSILEICNERLLHFAISDGATESSFSREWSDLLVRSYKIYSYDPRTLQETLTSLSQIWQAGINDMPLPWYAQEKAAAGAFATFLGVTIDKIAGSYHAVGIGDSTLFQIRGNALHQSFPIQKIEEFGNTPNLFSTNPTYQRQLGNVVKYIDVQLQADDTIILATDALAAWIFFQLNFGEKPWVNLRTLLSYEEYLTDFKHWTRNKINDCEIRNDDVSLVIIEIE